MSKLAIIASITLLSSSALADDSAVASHTAVALSAVASAQRSDDAEVFARGRLIEHHGYYAAPTLGATSLNGQLSPIVGMRSAWVVNHAVGVGVAFNALANHVADGPGYAGRALGGYGGLLLEYGIAATELVHGSIDTTIGGGVMCQQTGIEGDDDCVGHGFFAVEPTANVQLNLTRFMRLAVGGGYRVAVGASGSTLSNRELGGFVARAALELGKF